MHLLPITLGLASLVDAKPPSKEDSQALMKSHGYRCAFCSFLALGALKPAYCEEAKRWAPACPLCYDSMNLDAAEKLRPNGGMIALDGLSQASINHVINTNWLLSQYDDEGFKGIKEGLTMSLSKFDFAANSMRNLFGKESNELELFIAVLENIPPQRYKRRGQILAPVRYFNPSEQDYSAAIDYWRKASYPRLIETVRTGLESIA